MGGKRCADPMTSTENNERADIFPVTHGFAASRAEAQAAIHAGGVEADGAKILKPTQRLRLGMNIKYQAAHPYVSRGGVKFAAALTHFDLSPEGQVCLDVGASTGGFTQVLLQRGASGVYAVDVGHGQLHGMVRSDSRVIAKEGMTARDLGRAQIPEPLGAIVADVSFISLKLALAPALQLAASKAWAVFLVKPQFEVGPLGVGRGGIVRDEALRQTALSDLGEWMRGKAWNLLGTMESTITGADGNHEYFIAATRG